MKIYKATILGDDNMNEFTIDPAGMTVCLQTQRCCMSTTALVDPSASHNFIVQEEWEKLNRATLIPTTVKTKFPLQNQGRGSQDRRKENL